ncbi:hypothetical protein D3C75_876010 [compost metagenome]
MAALRPELPLPFGFMASSRFSSGFKQPIRLGFWNTSPILSRRKASSSASLRKSTCFPSTWTLPEVGSANSARIFSSVDLPQPEGPITVISSLS